MTNGSSRKIVWKTWNQWKNFAQIYRRNKCGNIEFKSDCYICESRVCI